MLLWLARMKYCHQTSSLYMHLVGKCPSCANYLQTFRIDNNSKTVLKKSDNVYDTISFLIIEKYWQKFSHITKITVSNINLFPSSFYALNTNASYAIRTLKASVFCNKIVHIPILKSWNPTVLCILSMWIYCSIVIILIPMFKIIGIGEDITLVIWIQATFSQHFSTIRGLLNVNLFFPCRWMLSNRKHQRKAGGVDFFIVF